MLYEITYLSKEPIAHGRCIECDQQACDQQAISSDPNKTGFVCCLSGEFLPDELDFENKPWDGCPVVQCVEQSGVNLDKFGKLVRDIRITRSLLLYDMAKTLDISPVELSAIECGRKPVPEWFIPALEKHYGIGETCAHTLRFLAKNRGD